MENFHLKINWYLILAGTNLQVSTLEYWKYLIVFYKTIKYIPSRVIMKQISFKECWNISQFVICFHYTYHLLKFDGYPRKPESQGKF